MIRPIEPRSTVPTAGTYAWLAAGVVAFTLYGSFVPFHYQWRPWDEVVGAWEWVLQNRLVITSRSDFLANALLGVPLGFCLLGAVRVDRPGLPAALVTSLLVWPACVLFAIAVEFAQLYFPGRTASASDVVAQAPGSGVGVAGWLIAGSQLTRWARRLWSGPRVGGVAGRLLVGYLALLTLVQLLPLDLTISPAEVYRKLRDRVSVVPFGDATTEHAQSWLVLAALYLPVGLLASQRDEPFWRQWNSATKVFGLGLLLAFGLESLQFIVASRSPGVTDILIGGSSVTLGWAIGRMLPATGPGLTVATALALGLAWATVLILTAWPPFDFQSGIAGRRFDNLDWVPFAGAYEKNYLSSLEETLTKVMLFAPLGAIVAAFGPRPGSGHVVAAVLLGAVTAAGIEAGQLFLPTRFPSPTDLVFGALGGWLGATTTLKVRTARGVVRQGGLPVHSTA